MKVYDNSGHYYTPNTRTPADDRRVRERVSRTRLSNSNPTFTKSSTPDRTRSTESPLLTSHKFYIQNVSAESTKLLNLN
jgi:hypothetical protein